MTQQCALAAHKDKRVLCQPNQGPRSTPQLDPKIANSQEQTPSASKLE